jgi:hypothetical protein
MFVYADNSNLYNTEPAQQTVSNTATVATTAPVANFWNPDFGLLTDIGVQLKPFISSLNYFVLGWCIFYSVLSVASFFFMEYYTEHELYRIRLGTEYITRAAQYWWGYLICLVFFVWYQFFPALGLFVVAIYFFKIVFADIPNVLDLPDDDYDFSAVITNYRAFTKPIRKALRFQFAAKKPAKK